MKTLDPAEVCDRAFGEWTRDTPTPKWLSNWGPNCWHIMFDGPMPRWWVEPRRCEKSEPQLEIVRHNFNGGGDA